LAREMNITPRKVQVLLAKLRDAKAIELTGEVTPDGIPVYRIGGAEIGSRMISSGDENGSRGEPKSCRFCREGETKSAPNRQVVERQSIDNAAIRLLRSQTCARDGCSRPQCPHWQQCAYHACCEDCAAMPEPA
jgi:hypothetical protein